MGSYEKGLLDLLGVPTDFSETEISLFFVKSGIFSLLGVCGNIWIFFLFDDFYR